MGTVIFLALLSQSWAQIGLPPIITVPPLSQTVTEGNNAQFTVVVTSVTTLSYQWRFNGTNILNASASSFTRTNTTLADAGNYSVEVRNASGTNFSSNAKLTVQASPVRITSVALVNDGIKLRIEGPALRTFVVMASADLTNWTPIYTNTTLLNGTWEYIDNDTVEASGDSAVNQSRRRFYRIKMP